MNKKTPRKSLKDLTPEELRARMKKYEAALYAQDIDAAFKESGAVSAFVKAQALLKGKGVSDLQLLEALGREAKIPRLVLSQGVAQPRAKRAKTGKTTTTRAAAAKKATSGK